MICYEWIFYCHMWTHALECFHCQNKFVTGLLLNMPKDNNSFISCDYGRVVWETESF